MNVEMGDFAARESIKLEPLNASTYALLANTYAAAGLWDEVVGTQHDARKRYLQGARSKLDRNRYQDLSLSRFIALFRVNCNPGSNIL